MDGQFSMATQGMIDWLGQIAVVPLDFLAGRTKLLKARFREGFYRKTARFIDLTHGNHDIVVTRKEQAPQGKFRVAQTVHLFAYHGFIKGMLAGSFHDKTGLRCPCMPFIICGRYGHGLTEGSCHIKGQGNTFFMVWTKEAFSLGHEFVIICPEDAVVETDAPRHGNGDLLTDFGYITVLAIDRHGIDSRSHAAADAHPKFQAVAQM